MRARLGVVFFALVVTLMGCWPRDSDEFVRSIFPDLKYEDVLAFKYRGKSPYNCTYVVLRLPSEPEKKPPRVLFPDLAFYDDFVKAGVWKPTGKERSVELSEQHLCLTASPEKVDGALIDGVAAEIMQILVEPDAWYSEFGGVEGHTLLIYAPKHCLAIWMRFGD